MVIRIVKLTFQLARTEDFKNFFDEIKQIVNSFPGCRGMQLLQDSADSRVFFTYSQWDSEEDLNQYRFSDTFGQVWPKIKPWFSAPPEAWTTIEYFNGFNQLN